MNVSNCTVGGKLVAGIARLASPCRLFVFVASIWLATASLPAQTATTGSITGRIFNPATNQYIRNAEVRIPGTHLATVSDSDGSYRLVNVPPGEVTVEVAYSGYKTTRAAVSLSAGQTATRDFDLMDTGFTTPTDGTVVTLETLVVSTQRAGQAKAIMDQKAAMNMRTVVATDNFGDIAEGNIGEFLKFLPGITLDYVETDTRAARMGGLEARYGSLTLNGARVANTNSGTFGGDTRQPEFEAISINTIETIEVYKTLNADMPADSPAGRINVITKSPLDRKGMNLSYTAGFIGNQYEHSFKKTPRHDDTGHAKSRPTFLFDYSDNFFDGRLGIGVNGAFSNVFKEQFRETINYNYTATQAIAAGRPMIDLINFKDGPKMTQKSSGAVVVDYQATPKLRVSFNTDYTYFRDEIANRNFAFRVNVAQVDPTSTLTHVVANPVASANTRVGHEGGNGDKYTDTTNAMLRFVYKGDRLTLDGTASYSRARQQNGTDHGGWVNTANANLTRISWTADRPSVDSPAWRFTQTSGPSWYDLGNYNRTDALVGNITNNKTASETLQLVGQANAKYVLPWQQPSYLKTGVHLQNSHFTRNQSIAYTGTFVGTTGNQLTAILPVSPADFRTSVWGTNLLPFQVPDKTVLHTLMRNNSPQLIQTLAQQAADLDAILGGNQDIEEEIAGVYLLGDTRIGKLEVMAGVRFEGTDTTTLLYERVPDALNPFSATTQPLERVRHRWSRPPSEKTGSYDDFLPSASAKYEITRDFIAKIGYHKAIQRPPLNQLGGLITVNDTNLTVTLPNANLQPERSEKLMVDLSYYFEPAGVLSFTYSWTDITNPIDSTGERPASEFGYGDDPLYSGYDFISFFNLDGKRKVHGFEIHYAQRLSFLPSILKNLTLDTSYSRYKMAPLPATAPPPQNATLSLKYNQGKFSANLGGTWTDDQKFANGLTSVLYNGDIEYIKERYIFDVGVRYEFTKSFGVFLSGRNAFNSGKTWYFKDSDGRIRQVEKYGGQWTAGISGRF